MDELPMSDNLRISSTVAVYTLGFFMVPPLLAPIVPPEVDVGIVLLPTSFIVPLTPLLLALPLMRLVAIKSPR
jgi:hypothetical protein